MQHPVLLNRSDLQADGCRCSGGRNAPSQLIQSSRYTQHGCADPACDVAGAAVAQPGVAYATPATPCAPPWLLTDIWEIAALHSVTDSAVARPQDMVRQKVVICFEVDADVELDGGVGSSTLPAGLYEARVTEVGPQNQDL
jgi:hypothetical protein